MAKLIYNKDRFTRVDKWDDMTNSYKGILLSTKINQKNGQDYKLLDAIDIDWNRAWFGPTTSYINSTEELFDAIESLDKSAQINAISEQLDEVVDTYVTQQQLEELTFNFQNILHYGEHIQIDPETNTISTYDLVSNQDLYDFSNSYVSHEFFDSYAYTRVQTDAFVTEKIREIIGGADEAFDTIQEISEWIMDQTSFKPIDYSEININSGTRYYIFNNETNKYMMVNADYITEHPDEQYYVVASIREELVDIYDQIAYINDERIGQAIWDDEYGMYTYTGLLKEIDNLQQVDESILYDLNVIHGELETASHLSSVAYSTSYIAFGTANEAYSMAYSAYEMAKAGSSVSLDAYRMAYSAYTQVGHPSYDGYFRLLTEEEKSQLNVGDPVYIYLASQDYYMPSHYANDGLDYYVYVEPEEATGLHKAVEDVTLTANSALYNLHVDNTNSNGYINLTITPQSYEGDKSRIIHLNTTKAEYSITTSNIGIDGKEYEVQQYDLAKDGIFTAYEINEILSYIFQIDEIKPISI